MHVIERGTREAGWMMNRRPLILLLAPLLAFGVVGCSSEDDASSGSTTVADASDSSGTADDVTETSQDPAAAADDPAGDAADDMAPPHIEAALSSGATFSGDPEECTVDGQNAVVRADGGAFSLTITDGAGTMTWTYDGGEITTEVSALMREGGLITSGVTQEGEGWNVDVQCA